MAIDYLFSGSALGRVDAAGLVVLPAFVRRVIERRCEAPWVVFGAHESDPCLSGYDEGYEAVLYAELRRQRLRDERGGASAPGHHARARRTFGLVERASFDSAGRVLLPPMMRRKGAIRDRALFVGAGGSFEIWNPDLAREASDVALRELAEFAAFQEAM